MKNYLKTDQQLHWLSQLIARANRSFVPEQTDDSHTNLYFDSLGDRIVGRWITTEKGLLLLTLKLSTLHIEWLDADHQTVVSFPTPGKTYPEMEQAIANHLPAETVPAIINDYLLKTLTWFIRQG